jgi:leader peptidase (prepilin peptidase) / N-methyltransferase
MDVLISIAIGIVGLAMGAAINVAIYSWAIINPRPISPWQKKHDDAAPRRWQEYIPVIGWFYLRRDARLFSRFFWIRPMLLELASCIFLVWFYWWQIDGGLIGNDLVSATVPWTLKATWFAVFSLVLALMAVATFIDFDEKMIPDEITIPGTLIGLILAALVPSSHLPIVVNDFKSKEVTLETLQFASPFPPGLWYTETTGLLVALAILWAWCFAFLPGVVSWHKGIYHGVKLWLASITRPKRRTVVAFERKPRRGLRKPEKILLLILLTIALFGSIGIVATWMYGGAAWLSLMSSLIGLAFAGGLVWIVRIVATYALQQEAMGFGDVTLMFMLGTYFGWQASLLIFVFAPFAAIFIALAEYLITRRNEIAFGPYLCLSAVFLLLRWPLMWNQWAGPRIFSLGIVLFYIIGFSLILMVLMLMGLRWLRGTEQPED